MQRNGKQLKTTKQGAKRCASDARTAWRHMDDEQRSAFLRWVVDENGTKRGASPGHWLLDDEFCVIVYDRNEGYQSGR